MTYFEQALSAADKALAAILPGDRSDAYQPLTKAELETALRDAWGRINSVPAEQAESMMVRIIDINEQMQQCSGFMTKRVHPRKFIIFNLRGEELGELSMGSFE